MLLLPLLLLPALLLAEEPVCKKCEVIRDYNKSHPGDFEYYDDYLESLKNKKEKTPESPPSK